MDAIWVENLERYWAHIASFLTLALATGCSGHAALYKRNSRSAIGWIGLILLVPVLGSVLYVLLGINRVRRKAITLFESVSPRHAPGADPEDVRSLVANTIGEEHRNLANIARIVGAETNTPLLAGNRIDPLFGGDRAFPAMLAAIEAAQNSVTLASYHFSNDAEGQTFVQALIRAHQRGVKVRVLLDDFGQRTYLPNAYRPLSRANVPTALFLPAFRPWPNPFINLRNHRKILVVDGKVGFTGGMNIHDGHVRVPKYRSPVRDIHFRLQGPVVADLQRTFVRDWFFAARDVITGDAFFPLLLERGNALARGIPDGPDGELDTIRFSMLAGLEAADHSVQIVTPYFVPDETLMTSLSVAAMSGIDVDIILPEHSNMPFVDWATRHQIGRLIQRGVRVWLAPSPFDHSKLMVVDKTWSLFGSANWDARSLRLNFEFCVESYDHVLGDRLARRIAARKRISRQLTLEELAKRPFPIRLRDGIARLFTPYL